MECMLLLDYADVGPKEAMYVVVSAGQLQGVGFLIIEADLLESFLYPPLTYF